jgi:hypothetical protein
MKTTTQLTFTRTDIVEALKLLLISQGYTGDCTVNFKIKIPWFGEDLMTFPTATIVQEIKD